MFASDIMDRLKEGRMTINSTSQFNNLVALLYSFNVSSMPSEDAISLMLKEELCKTVGAKLFYKFMKLYTNV